MAEEKKKVQLSVTEKQLRYIMYALEEYFRLRMGQSYVDLVDELAFQNVEPDEPGGKYSTELFNECIARRDDARVKLEEFFDVCFERKTERMRKTEHVNNAIDLWHVIRHWLWEQMPVGMRGNGTDSYPCILFGNEPMPHISLEEENK